MPMKARPEMDERLLDEALAWRHALQADDADWDGFTLWLEADPRHRQAFDELVLTERLVDEHANALRRILVSPVEAGPIRPAPRRAPLYGAIAATLALAVSVPLLWPGPADRILVTASGQSRSIALASGVAVDLAPATRLIVRHGDATTLQLAGGAAYFSVRHDPQRALSIRVGDLTVTDIGTKFAVSLDRNALTVGVAEGQVGVTNAAGQTIRLAPGQQLISFGDRHLVRLSQVEPSAIGSWRRGRLIYDDAPLSIVAADITRYSGETVVIDPSIKDKSFSGVLVIGDGSKLLANLTELMALSYRVEGNHIRVSAAPH